MTFSEAFALADTRCDAGDRDAADAINYCGALAESRGRHISNLVAACREKNHAKREHALASILVLLRQDIELGV